MPTIELDSEAVLAHTIRFGGDTQIITAGEKLDIKAGDVELLDETVPAGKTWEVNLSVYIVETNA